MLIRAYSYCYLEDSVKQRHFALDFYPQHMDKKGDQWRTTKMVKA